MIAAIPAGFLAFLLVQTFLQSADKLTMTVQIVVGVTLACAALVTLMPFGLLIFGGRKEAAVAAAAPSKGKATYDDDVESSDDADDFGDADEVDEIEEADETIGFEESDADIMADSNDEIESGGSSLDEIESIDFDDDDEEPAPKKRKK